MADIQQIPTRREVPEEKTWDLSVIFKTQEDFESAFSQVKELTPKVKALQGSLKEGAESFLHALKAQLDYIRKAEKVYVYSHLLNDQDTAEATGQALKSRSLSLLAEASEATAWFEPEVLSLSNEEIWSYFDQEPKLEQYRLFVERITEKRAHVLPAEQEAILAAAEEVFSGASQTFSILNDADLEFSVVHDEQGKEIQLTHGVYQTLMESTKREVRKETFEANYQSYKQYVHTFASTLSTTIKAHNLNAKLHHYKDAREAAQSASEVPEQVYDTLLQVVDEHLPLLHRYVTLRKKLLGVDELHMFDLYTPILGEPPVLYSYEQAQEKVLAALEPMGKEYLDVVKSAFRNRWIDVVENKGKASGAYSSGCYDTYPYILLNWHDTLDQVFTLIHEMGHSVHSYFTRNFQPHVYGHYSIFLAEIASTTNENLLTEYMLKTEDNPKVKAYVLNHYLDGFKGTVFRQTQFANFEHFMHTQDALGNPLTADFLCEHYRKLNERFYGPSVISDSQISYEWARIPHFYYNYYVYQYATGFSAASALSANILAETTLADGTTARDAVISYLKSGSSDKPIEIMKRAGVDMTKPDYLRAAFKMFEQRLNEFEELL